MGLETMMTKRPVLDRERSELRTQALALRDAIGDGVPTTEQEATADALRTKLEAVERQLGREEWFDKVEARTGDRPDSQAREWTDQARQYSIRKAVADAYGIARGLDVGLETEVQAELKRRTGRAYEGVPAPIEALSIPAEYLQTRATTTTPSAGPGSRIITTDYRPGEYIDLLRDGLVTQQLGIRVLRGLDADLRIPKARSGITTGWATESGALATGDLSFETPLQMTPHKVGGFGTMSQQMLIQASPDIEMLFREDFAAALAQQIDSTVLTGGGSNEPRGVISRTTETARSGDANGKLLTTNEILALAETVDAANIGRTTRGFLLDTETMYWAMQQPAWSGTNARRANMYEGGMLLGMRAVVSNITPKADKGTTSDASQLIYGNWSDLLLGYWGDLDLTANPYGAADFQAGNVSLRIMTFADIAIRYPESFGYYDGVIFS